jgi:hypothetical protein
LATLALAFGWWALSDWRPAAVASGQALTPVLIAKMRTLMQSREQKRIDRGIYPYEPPASKADFQQLVSTASRHENGKLPRQQVCKLLAIQQNRAGYRRINPKLLKTLDLCRQLQHNVSQPRIGPGVRVCSI